MARRRRGSGRAPLRLVALLAALAGVFALGIWLGRGGGRELVARWRAGDSRPAREPSARPSGPRRAPAAAAEAPTRVAEPPGRTAEARVAIVIDDLGRSVEEVDRLLALGVPFSYAVLPFEPRSAEVAARLSAAGAEILVHLPMEPEGGEDPGPNAILERQRPRRVGALTEKAVQAVAGATGLNNHMGSEITADPDAMGAVLDVVAARRLFFLDSRTTAETKAFEWARARGIPAARRDVFLDDDPASGAVAAQLERLLAVARERGAAIAIGHPRAATLAVLERELPRARAAGIEFVPVSFLLERSETLPE